MKRLSAALAAMVLCWYSCTDGKSAKATYFADAFSYSKTVKELNEVVKFVGFAPIVASRNYAYANIAAYECIAAGYPKEYNSLAGQIHGLTSMPKPDTAKQIDFEFAIKKADSLQAVLNELDKRAIALDESTFFTNETLKRYNLPKINLAQDKATVQSQYYYAVNNRESAAYRLQKETPIIEPLDRPEPPYDAVQKSKLIYTILGLFLGAIIGVLLVSWKIINKYMADELNKAIEKASKPKEVLLVPQEEPVK